MSKANEILKNFFEGSRPEEKHDDLPKEEFKVNVIRYPDSDTVSPKIKVQIVLNPNILGQELIIQGRDGVKSKFDLEGNKFYKVSNKSWNYDLVPSSK